MISLYEFTLKAKHATEGSNAAPAVDAVLADTGQLYAGRWRFYIFATAAIAGFVKIQHRNAANSANVAVDSGAGTRDVRLDLPASASAEFYYWQFDVLTNERVRVISGGSASPQQAYILYAAI